MQYYYYYYYYYYFFFFFGFLSQVKSEDLIAEAIEREKQKEGVNGPSGNQKVNNFCRIV